VPIILLRHGGVYLEQRRRALQAEEQVSVAGLGCEELPLVGRFIVFAVIGVVW
jgi:hypothetical protein